MKQIAGAITAILSVAAITLASPTTVMFTKGVNGYTGMKDKTVYEKMNDWGRFYYGDSYILANEQG